MESLYIVIPAYNEEENIEEVVKAWYPVLSGKSDLSRLVVADSGSTDNTHFLLLEMKKQYSQLEILENTGKQHGPKLIALYDYAIKNDIDYIFQTDSDGQTNPAEFDHFWNLRKEYVGIFGHRIAREDGKLRAYVEKVVCLLSKYYFGVNIPDANAPFRLMKTKTVKKYLYQLPTDYNLPNIMMTVYFSYHKEKIKFINISFKPRQGGKNSINIVKIIRIGWKSLRDFSGFRKELHRKSKQKV